MQSVISQHLLEKNEGMSSLSASLLLSFCATRLLCLAYCAQPLTCVPSCLAFPFTPPHTHVPYHCLTCLALLVALAAVSLTSSMPCRHLVTSPFPQRSTSLLQPSGLLPPPAMTRSYCHSLSPQPHLHFGAIYNSHTIPLSCFAFLLPLAHPHQISSLQSWRTCRSAD
jgi:hypothetical protein